VNDGRMLCALCVVVTLTYCGRHSVEVNVGDRSLTGGTSAKNEHDCGVLYALCVIHNTMGEVNFG